MAEWKVIAERAPQSMVSYVTQNDQMTVTGLEGAQDQTKIQKLKEAVVRGDKVFNMSGGEQLRDYLPVGEIARQIVRLAMMEHDIGVINICSGEPVSVHKLVERWLHENNWKIGLNLGYYPYPDYEPMDFWGDSSRIDNINAPE